jgi:predicted nuclease with RNAse H fold
VSAGGFRTAGVDLASQDRMTALAVIRWSVTGAVLEVARVGVNNEAIIVAARGVQLIGIDCPIGWPRPFTDLLVAARGSVVPVGTGADDAGRRVLAYRRTDQVIRERTGRWPLSVSADRIAYPAMRCAGLLAELAADGHRVVRSGRDSVVAEVYPAAALRVWGCRTTSYKTDLGSRAALVAELAQRTSWLDWGDHRAVCVTSADALDAVVCALIAGAVMVDRTAGPSLDDRVIAEEEGWIHLPDEDFLQAPFR